MRIPILIAAMMAPSMALSIAASAPALAQQVAGPGVAAAKPASGPGEVAKRAPINGVLVLYGNERCPTNNNGEEIVICERRSAQEQYRVPKELREFQVTPENASWAAKAQATLDTGNGVDTIGSCSTSGAGGQTGCFAQQANAARAERRAMDKAAHPDLP